MAAGNKLLAALCEAAPSLTGSVDRIQLKPGDAPVLAGQRPAHILFPAGGLISLMATGNRASIEVAMLGRGDLVGLSAILGAVTRTSAIVRAGGEAHRVPAKVLAALLDTSPEARALLFGYVQERVTRAYLMAARTSEQTLLQRLARWLLEAGDCLESPALPFTHEHFSVLLGVRRASVTVALHDLQGEGLIRSTRGRVEVIDPVRLRAAAGELPSKKAA